MKPDGRLKVLDAVLRALDQIEASSHRTYWTLAKRRGPRMAKLVMRARLRAWRAWFNEPSHYSAPGHRRRIGERHVRSCVSHLRTVLDKKDFGLVVAAYNEILSGGIVRATLAGDADNSPAITQKHVLRAKDLTRSPAGDLQIATEQFRFRVLPDDAEERPRRFVGPVMVAGEVVPILQGKLVNAAVLPIDLTNSGTMLRSLMSTKADQKRVQRRLRRLGYRLRIGRPQAHAGQSE